VFTPATTPPTQTANDRSTTGALSGMLRNPTGGRKKYLVSVGANIAAAHYFGILLDRHLTSGSHRLTVTSAETVASPVAVVRQYGVSGNNGVGNVIHMPVSTARATPGAGTLTVTYTDQDGNSAAGPALALPATADPVNRCLAHIHVGIPFIRLNDGDYGVRSVSETQRAATADTTGIASLAVSQPLAFVPNLGILGMYTEVDLPNQMAGLVELADSSGTLGCYYFMMYANGTSGAHQLLLRTIEG